MFTVWGMYFANTVYSPGYDESRFRQVRMAMTSEEVEVLMGPPLRKITWWPDQNLVCWEYTAKRHSGDYWRRDVFVKDGKVFQITNVYWID